jgi:hypothetical protein
MAICLADYPSVGALRLFGQKEAERMGSGMFMRIGRQSGASKIDKRWQTRFI